MDPNIVKRDVIYVSSGTESDSKIFQSMMEKAQIDVNSTYAKNVMFTTPNLKSFQPFEAFQTGRRQRPRISLIAQPRPMASETFVSRHRRKIEISLGIMTVAGLLLLVFGATRFLQGKTR